MKTVSAAMFCLFPLACTTSTAQSAPTGETPEPEATEPSVEEVKAFLTRIDGMIASREERATRLLNEIRAHDQRIEAGIKSLTNMLAKATDTRQSKTRVARLKRDFIEDLEKAAMAYGRKRAEIEEEMRNEPNRYTREDLFKARGAIDDRISNRVQQIVELATSFDSHKDLEKYTYLGGGGGWNGGWTDTWQRNPEYQQNRRASSHGNQAHKGVAADLDEAATRLDRQAASLREQLRVGNTLPEAQRKDLERELDRIENLRQARQEQRDELIGSYDPPPTKPMSLNQAMSMDDQIETTVADLRQDAIAMFNGFRDWKTTRAQIGDCMMRRDRAAKWLEAKNATPAAP